MADITEVIHKITYEVNDEALGRVTKVLESQLAELSKLNGELQKLQESIGRTSYKQVESLQKLEAEFRKIAGKIEQTAGKTKGVLETVGEGVLKAFGADGGLTDIIGNFLKPAAEELKTVESAGKLTFSSLAARALSFGNVVTAAISIISLFAVELGKANNKAGELGEKTDKIAEFSKELGKEAGSEVGNLLSLKTKIEDTTLSYDKRLQAIKKLRDEYPGYFKHLKDEEFLIGNIGEAYNKVLTAIIANAKARVLDKQLEGILEDLIKTDQVISSTAKDAGIKLETEIDSKTGLTKYRSDDLKQGFYNQKTEGKGVPPADATANNRQRPIEEFAKRDTSNDDKEKKNKAREIILYELANRSVILNRLAQIEKLIIENNANVSDFNTPQESPSTNERPKLNFKLSTSQPGEDEVPKELLELDKQAEKKANPNEESPESIELKRQIAEIKAKEEEEKKQKELKQQEERRAAIKKTMDAYESLASSAVKAFETIYAAQVKALDAEIDIRKKRVEAAKELAERGNTEALRLEEERLAAATKKREEYARRQQVINSVLTVSNAVLAVAKAAGETGPAAIAIVPAVIAAIVAGYAAISAATKESTAQAFADGVINFRGKGGPRDDANWVRISSGESIITADGTRKNHALLEAINKGANLQFLNPALVNALPMLKQPEFSSPGNYASSKDLKSLERKFDEVVYAIEGNKLRQNIFFNEQGVGIMTEKAVNRNKKKWS